MSNADRIAERMTLAFDTRDARLFDELYSSDATVWHSFDQVNQDRAAAMSGVRSFFGALSALQCEDIRRLMTEEGFVQQHLLSGEFSAGGGFQRLPVCLVVRVLDGKIARIEEYIDPKGFAPKRA